MVPATRAHNVVQRADAHEKRRYPMDTTRTKNVTVVYKDQSRDNLEVLFDHTDPQLLRRELLEGAVCFPFVIRKELIWNIIPSSEIVLIQIEESSCS